MKQSGHISIHDVRECIDCIYDLVKYRKFTVVDIKDKINISPNRLTSILRKAEAIGLCDVVGTKMHRYISKNIRMYRMVNTYRLNFNKYKPITKEGLH